MKKLSLLPIFLLLLVAGASAQSDKPDYGEIDEIAGKKKVFLEAEDPFDLKKMKIALAKSDLVIVRTSADADFFLEYKRLDVSHATSLNLEVVTGRLDAYYYREGQKVIVHSASKTAGMSGSPAGGLVKDLLKQLKIPQ